MQIYSKSMKNATSLSFHGRFWFCLVYLIGLGAGFKTSNRILKFINYANSFKINVKCYFSVISWPILILLFICSFKLCVSTIIKKYSVFKRRGCFMNVFNSWTFLSKNLVMNFLVSHASQLKSSFQNVINPLLVLLRKTGFFHRIYTHVYGEEKKKI